jgi:tetrapyrrole methylase family protein/MazG family protein
MNKDRLAREVVALSELVSKLRGPDGCPWDREQTASTVKLYLLEEAHEVLDAIENGSPEDVCEELGDLLFQIIFLSDLAEDRGEFDLVAVIEKIRIKMKRRHPHVFGGAYLENSKEVSEQWNKIKRMEKGSHEDTPHPLEKVPVGLPSLMKAHRLCERAEGLGIDLEQNTTVRERVFKAFEDLPEIIAEGDKERIRRSVGDLLFGLANLSRTFGFNAEDLLRAANNRFIENQAP